MMQFGLASYQNNADYASSVKFINHYKSNYLLDKHATELLNAAMRSTTGIGKMVLISARLHFWGQIDITDFPIICQHITQENYSKADFFEKQELLNCLGHELLTKFIGLDLDTTALDTTWSEGDHITIDLESQSSDYEVWAYVPPPTGFFSVVENIVLAKFFCAMHKKRFKLDLVHSWWRYPVPFLDLMGLYGQDELQIRSPHKHYITWDVMRDSFRNIPMTQISFLKKFKTQEYRKIKSALRLFSNDMALPARPNPEECILFKRGGDKVKLETIEGPDHLIRQDVLSLVDREISVRVLSDDYDLAQYTVALLGLPPSANITASDRLGYHLGNPHAHRDVHMIIQNFLILSNAKYSLSCPSSNIVNSAHWANRVIDPEFRPSSLPSLRYLYL